MSSTIWNHDLLLIKKSLINWRRYQSLHLHSWHIQLERLQLWNHDLLLIEKSLTNLRRFQSLHLKIRQSNWSVMNNKTYGDTYHERDLSELFVFFFHLFTLYHYCPYQWYESFVEWLWNTYNKIMDIASAQHKRNYGYYGETSQRKLWFSPEVWEIRKYWKDCLIFIWLVNLNLKKM